MNCFRCFVVPVSLMLLGGCGSFTLDSGPIGFPSGDPSPHRAPKDAPVEHVKNPYGHLPQRASFCAKSSVELKEGCYSGDFELGSVQIQVRGAGVDKTVIHGNLVVKTQCVVSNLTVTGDVIFEGNQAKLVDVDFFGRIIDNGVQNQY